MNHQISLKTKSLIVGLTILIFGILIYWEHTHGGVATHHLLHRADLPGISNWWGLLILPLLTIFVLFDLEKRLSKLPSGEVKPFLKKTLLRLLAATAFGILVCVLFTIESPFLGYMFLALMLLAFFFPLFYTEYWLGFVLGSMYVLGAFIPFIFGALYILIFWIFFQLVKWIKGLFNR